MKTQEKELPKDHSQSRSEVVSHLKVYFVCCSTHTS